jgi:hypothetical protein
MKYLVLFTLAAFIAADMVNFSPASKNINVFDHLIYRDTALKQHPAHDVVNFYSSVSGEPIVVTKNHRGHVSFTNIRTKLDTSDDFYSFDATSYDHYLHFVRNGSDYVLLYSFKLGGIKVFRDGIFLLGHEDIHYYVLPKPYAEPGLLYIFNDYVIVTSNEFRIVTIFKFNSDYTYLQLIPYNDPIYDSIRELKNFYTITDNNKDYLYNIDKNMINFYSIENGQITKIKSLNNPGTRNHPFLVVNDVVYTTDGKSIFKYNKTKNINETIKTFYEYEIDHFESLNENTLVIQGVNLESYEVLLLLDIDTGEFKGMGLPQNDQFAIFDGFIAIAKKYRSGHEYEYLLDVDVYDTVNRYYSFLF